MVYGVKESSMNNAREIVLGSLDDTDAEWTLCWGLSPSVRAVITKYHRPGALNNSNLFLIVLETGKCKRRPSAPLGSDEGSRPGCRGPPSPGSSSCGEIWSESALLSLLIRAQIPSYVSQPHDLI